MNESKPNRREVLRTAGAVGALNLTGALPHARRGRSAETLRIGLVGCGGRGTGAAVNALRADENTKLVAMGDVFADHLDERLVALSEVEDIAERVDVDPEHRFTGWDAYLKVIEASDVVLLATSPHFRPLHVAAAVAAGKHLFVEKPVAVDVPGLRWMRESCETAKSKGLSVVSGLCYRYHNAKRATMQRIHDGAIGDVVALQTSYNANGLWHRGRKPEWTEMEFQIRNWLYFNWLSGDHITEQHIHSLDKLAWTMGGYPESCVASGGRIVRTDPDYGDVYDHFNCTFEWKGGVRGFASCRQWNDSATDVSDHVFGTRGRADIQGHKLVSGPWDWRYSSEEPDDMYQNEHDALFASIRSGEPINDGEYMINSTMMAIMGRMSAYTGQKISWEQAWSSELNLTPPAYAFGPAPEVVVARPGITQFV